MIGYEVKAYVDLILVWSSISTLCQMNLHSEDSFLMIGMHVMGPMECSWNQMQMSSYVQKMIQSTSAPFQWKLLVVNQRKDFGAVTIQYSVTERGWNQVSSWSKNFLLVQPNRYEATVVPSSQV